MVKSNKQFICQFCGTIHLKWSGKCEQCNQWNSLLEENTSKPSGPLSKSSGQKISFEFLNNETLEYSRLKTSFNEMDRVFGGGLVPGSVTLIGGDPGIGNQLFYCN